MTFHSLFDVTQNLGRISGHDSVGGNIFGDDAAGAYNRVLADVGVGKNRGARADGCTFLYDRRSTFQSASVCRFPSGVVARG